MDFAELKNKSKTELSELLGKERAELFKLEQAARAKQLKQVHSIALKKKTIARLKSLLANA